MRSAHARRALVIAVLVVAAACTPTPPEPTLLERCLAERAALVSAITSALAAGPPATWLDFYQGSLPTVFFTTPVSSGAPRTVLGMEAGGDCTDIRIETPA